MNKSIGIVLMGAWDHALARVNRGNIVSYGGRAFKVTHPGDIRIVEILTGEI